MDAKQKLDEILEGVKTIVADRDALYVELKTLTKCINDNKCCNKTCPIYQQADVLGLMNRIKPEPPKVRILEI